MSVDIQPLIPGSVFRKLDDSRDEIRLLRLFPGQPGDELRCQYVIASLNDAPQYHTVSYVWGDASRKRAIKVDGVGFDILESLHSALSHIRQPEEGLLPIWTDALCINQKDINEKMHQVDMMHRIYRDCANCFIWLGDITSQPAMREASGAFDALQIFAGGAQGPVPPSLSDHKGRVLAGRGLQAMMNTAWWSRIWTVQEASLPPKATVLWGALRMPWDTILRAADSMVDNEEWPTWISIYELFSGSDTTLFTPPVLSIRDARDWIADNVSLLDRLWRFRHRQATDPRDKIYGIMALLGRNSLPSVPGCDYTLDAATLFTRVTLDLLRDEQSLKPLIGWRGERHVTSGLPTWALDFVRPEVMTARVWANAHFWMEFNADRGMPILDSANIVSDDGCVLHVTGLYVDRVEMTGDAIFEDDEAHKVPPVQLEQHIESWRHLVSGFAAREGPLRAGQRMEEFDYLVEGRLLRQDMAPVEGVDARKMWRQEMCKMQVVFATQDHTGLGPSTTLMGDEVWILSGGRTPFILRPCDSSVGGGESSQHEFVGDAFVHGIMMGEAMGRTDRRYRTVNLR